MKKENVEIFIEKARKIHGDKYDYSKVEYVNTRTKVCIICPIHGEFWQTPHNHLQNRGCIKCGIEKSMKHRKKTNNKFIEDARKIHGDKYDYSKVEYVNRNTEVIIICPIHGEFKQKPINHLNGHTCQICGLEQKNNKKRKKIEHFIEDAMKIHGDKYDYSKVEYVNAHTKICIICPIHGEFWQTPNNHLRGNGCPKCNQSKLENEMTQFLKDKNIEYIPQHTFEWLKNKFYLHLDFYLPKYNVAIECQGIQHFQEVEHFGGEEYFKYIINMDKNKKDLCESHGIKLFYYSNLGIDYNYKVYEDKMDLLKEIIRM